MSALFDLAHQFMKKAQLTVDIEVFYIAGRVIRLQVFNDTPVASAYDIASGKMQQRGMIGCAEEFDQMRRGFNVAAQSIAQVGIEVRQTRAIHNQIDRAAKALADLVVQS